MNDDAAQVIFLSQKNTAQREKAGTTVDTDMVYRNLRDQLPRHLVDDENPHDMVTHAHRPLLA